MSLEESPDPGFVDSEWMLSKLRLQLDEARNISEKNVAEEIWRAGFECLRCGECCHGKDNSVVVFPFEIRKIVDLTGESWLEVAEPPLEGEWDLDGNFHTLEWRLRKNGDRCKYYHKGTCQIYPARPILCQTYPFYMDEEGLICSECKGLNRSADFQKAMSIASIVKKRRLIEIREAIDLVRNYKDFIRGSPSWNGKCVVHDSEGEHVIEWSSLPGFLKHHLDSLEG